jgi:hypothetical protein
LSRLLELTQRRRNVIFFEPRNELIADDDDLDPGVTRVDGAYLAMAAELRGHRHGVN